ncbi:MAG: transcriptional regulator [Candidatus Cloacimonadota bacterium]|nr:MAG: transcriptional regulator [Candidatus Cloacimonadota bacterium]PIE80632.1 MAG: transcriptional regulator [Candidatus Delongbacteria bacterium]
MSVKPTTKELAILKILWEKGPTTVRGVNNIQNLETRVGYTTTLKVMQIMFEKGFLLRDTSKRSHIYSAKIKEKDTKNGILGNLMDTVFGGSAHKLVIQALGSGKITKEERDKIRAFLDKLEVDEDGN